MTNQNVTNQTLSDSYNNGQGNQAWYGYQAASSPSYYQSQSPAPYMDQPSVSQRGYPSYNTQGYNDNTAYQGYNGYSNTGYQRSNAYDNTGYQTTNGNDNTGYQRSNAYDNTAYQQYGESQSQSNVGKAGYYSNEQQYQNDADPGSYYTG